jgi:hypothetical protein
VESTTVTFDDFGNGIDRRVGTVSRAANKFLELSNYTITTGRKLKRRPPCRNVAGQLDANTQAVRYLNGQIVVVLPAGSTPTHTISGFSVRNAFFDMPEKALSEWVLLDLAIFNDQLVALIRHRFNSSAEWRTMLHVWDDTHPTYVTDPACPTTWSAELPLHAYGEGKLGAYADYTPVLAISADRVYLSRPDGNVAFSAAGRPRVWNTRAAAEILVDGEWFYWVSTNDPGDQTMVVPFNYYDLILDKRAAAYVVEYCGTDGRWVQLREQTILTAYDDVKIGAVANRWGDAAKPEVQLTYRSPGDGRVFRFRLLAKPPVIVQTGLHLTPNAVVVGGVLTHEGDGELVSSSTITGLTGATQYFVNAVVPGAPIPPPQIVAGTPGSMPINGQERYWLRILANAITNGGGTAFLYQLTGTVTVTAGGTRVAGAATAFLTELEVGRVIEINGERRTVKFIGSNLDCEVDAPFSAAYGPGVGLRDPRYRYAYEVGDAGNEWYAEKEANATFQLAGKDDAGYLGTALYDQTGTRPISISTLQNRLIVQFGSTVQAWAVGADALSDMRLLSVDGQAAGINTAPQGVLIDGMTALPTINGVRLFSPDGNNKDYIEFASVGDMLRGIALPNLNRAVWWPLMRTYLTCTASSDNDIVFYCLTRHKDTKVLGWQTWTVAGLRRVDALFVAGDDLVIQSGRNLLRFASQDTFFRDDADTTAPFTSRALFIYTDLGRPEKNKRLTRCEILQNGTSVVSVRCNPYRPGEVVPGPTISGTTFGRQRVPLAAMGVGIGLEVTSTDDTGHELDMVAFDYQLLKR